MYETRTRLLTHPVLAWVGLVYKIIGMHHTTTRLDKVFFSHVFLFLLCKRFVLQSKCDLWGYKALWKGLRHKS